MLAVVATALLGILSMHGWGTHTAGHLATDAAVHVGGAVSSQSPHDSAMLRDATDAPEVAPAMPGGTQDSAVSTLGLCLGLLGGLLLYAILRLRAVRQWSCWGVEHRGPPRVQSRDPDPPDLIRLSVIRC